MRLLPYVDLRWITIRHPEDVPLARSQRLRYLRLSRHLRIELNHRRSYRRTCLLHRAAARCHSYHPRNHLNYIVNEEGLYAAEIVLGLKASYPGITLESAIPCESQAAKWSEALRDRYFDIASKCDKETLIQTHYTPDCMDKRNRYMVDHADVLIAVWDGSPSGTGKTVRYAHQQGKSVTVINPVSLDVTQE